ncbi:MAG TPA: hypothetical protein VE547_12555 [Mycobacteriales bacterium]|nr:hypothetical protein [Mycobacteriales bacterium]
MNTGDLASRLRGAAETMPTAADRFAATLDRAGRLRRRRRRLGVASAAAAVTLAIALPTVVINRTAGGPAPAPAAAPALPSGKPGRAVDIAAARLAGTTLFVSFIGAGPDAAPTDPCGRDYRVEVAETDRTVSLLVREYLPLATLPPGHGCSQVGYSRVVPVQLASPLAARTVMDTATDSVVGVVRNVLTMRRSAEWTRTAESGEDSSWRQTFRGPAGEFTLNQGNRSIGVLTSKSFYQRTGTTTVRGTAAAWGTAPGETSIHWIEGDHGVQLLSPDLRVPDLVDIANSLTE